MSAVADVLDGAADLIERDGWVQGVNHLPTGEHCMNDAIEKVAGKALYWPAKRYVEAVVGFSATAAWNDVPGRTKAEVVSALRAAAERARA